MNNWFTFIIAILATYRLSLLVSKEDGPAWIFRKLRNFPPKQSSAHQGIRCEWCVSVYAAIFVASFIWWRNDDVSWIDAPFYALALSAGAIILNQVFTKGGK